MAEKIKMVRLRHIHSGALVEVPEEKAARLGSEWESADSLRRPSVAKTTTAKSAPAKKVAAKKSAAKVLTTADLATTAKASTAKKR